MSMRAARAVHGVTAAVAGFAMVFQLALVLVGAPVLVGDTPPSMGEQLLRFVSYFTILSNTLVMALSVTLLRRPDRDGPVWRVLRLCALVGITVTGVVHWFLLRPLLTLTGASAVADVLLHIVVPLLAVLGWVLVGPRRRVTGGTVALSLLYPVIWLAYTLVMGALRGWYPYPFLNVDELGAGPVAIACLGVTALVLVVSVLYWLGDRALGRAPREPVR